MFFRDAVGAGRREIVRVDANRVHAIGRQRDRLWLFDARVGPTTAPEGANTVNTTLRLLGRVANPPVLAIASEMICPACPVNVNKSVLPGTAIVPAASPPHGRGTASGL